MKQKQIETIAKEIAQKAKQAAAPAAEGAVVRYKDVLLGIYYLANTNGIDEIYVGVCNEDNPQGMMPYYATCSIREGVEVNREILQSTDSTDTDYRQHNVLLIEVLNRVLGALL